MERRDEGEAGNMSADCFTQRTIVNRMERTEPRMKSESFSRSRGVNEYDSESGATLTTSWMLFPRMRYTPAILLSLLTP